MGITVENKQTNTMFTMFRKTLSDGPSEIVRPLYNSNMAKVSIVNPNSPQLLESLKLPGEGQMALPS